MMTMKRHELGLLILAVLFIAGSAADLLQLQSALWQHTVPVLWLVLALMATIAALTRWWTLARQLEHHRTNKSDDTRKLLAGRLREIAEISGDAADRKRLPSREQRDQIRDLLPQIRAHASRKAADALQAAVEDPSTRAATLKARILTCADSAERP